MPPGERQLRRALVAAGRRLARLGLVAGTEGNLSARLDEEHILVTPSGVAKGELDTEEIVRVALEREFAHQEQLEREIACQIKTSEVEQTSEV